jgi:hypothetical protein
MGVNPGASSGAGYRIAYEASVHAIEDQARVLESLRTRAGTLFAATALVTSFLGGQALAHVAKAGSLEFHLWSFTAGAIASFVGLALLTLAILWPYRFRFSLSAREIIKITEDRSEAVPVGENEALREAALRYETMYDFNSRLIRALFWCFRLAILLLVGDVAAWIVVLLRGKA